MDEFRYTKMMAARTLKLSMGIFNITNVFICIDSFDIKIKDSKNAVLKVKFDEINKKLLINFIPNENANLNTYMYLFISKIAGHYHKHMNNS